MFPGQTLDSLPSIVPTGTGASVCQPFPTPNPEHIHASKEEGRECVLGWKEDTGLCS